jgi:hypothetical protein
MKEEFYQKKMIELEESKIKALLDIRDAIHVLTSIGMNFLVVDERVTVKNYQKTLDAVKEAHDVSDKRWAENE